MKQRTHAHERLIKAVAQWEAATGLTFDQYGGPSKRVIQFAQQLDDLRQRFSPGRSDQGFGFLASLADDLARASDTVRSAIATCGVTEEMMADQEIS